MARFRSILAVTLLLGMSGCAQRTQEEPAPGALTREQFVELFVALRNAQDSARTAEQYDSLRSAIYVRSGASAESLTRFTTDYGARVRFMAEVWDSIQRRLDNPAGPY